MGKVEFIFNVIYNIILKNWYHGVLNHSILMDIVIKTPNTIMRLTQSQQTIIIILIILFLRNAMLLSI